MYWDKFPEHGKASCKSESIVFSPDSRHCVFAAAWQTRTLIIANEGVVFYDGKEIAKHESILNMPFVFSPDSSRLAYSIQEHQKVFAVFDQRMAESYDNMPPITPTFSPDSHHVAYIARNAGEIAGREERRFLVVDADRLPVEG